MPLHTPPPSGNRRHLTSANAGASIHQSARFTSTAPRLEAGSVNPPLSLSASFSLHREAPVIGGVDHPEQLKPLSKETQDAKYDLHCNLEEHLIDGRRQALKGAGHQPFLTINDEAPSESVADEISDPILNTTGREQSRDLSTSYAPVVSGIKHGEPHG